MISESDESVPLQREHQVCQHMAGQNGRKGARRVPGFSIGDQGATTRERQMDERLARLGVRQQTSLGNRQYGRLSGLLLASFVE